MKYDMFNSPRMKDFRKKLMSPCVFLVVVSGSVSLTTFQPTVHHNISNVLSVWFPYFSVVKLPVIYVAGKLPGYR
jgi:hypothetical protein